MQVTVEAEVIVNAHTEQEAEASLTDTRQLADEKLRPGARWPEEGGGGRVLNWCEVVGVVAGQH